MCTEASIKLSEIISVPISASLSAECTSISSDCAFCAVADAEMQRRRAKANTIHSFAAILMVLVRLVLLAVQMNFQVYVGAELLTADFDILSWKKSAFIEFWIRRRSDLLHDAVLQPHAYAETENCSRIIPILQRQAYTINPKSAIPTLEKQKFLNPHRCLAGNSLLRSNSGIRESKFPCTSLKLVT